MLALIINIRQLKIYCYSDPCQSLSRILVCLYDVMTEVRACLSPRGDGPRQESGGNQAIDMNTHWFYIVLHVGVGNQNISTVTEYSIFNNLMHCL